MWWMNLISSETTEPLVCSGAPCIYKPVVRWTSCAYSLLMGANKLETALSRDRYIACLAPRDTFFFMYVQMNSVQLESYQLCHYVVQLAWLNHRGQSIPISLQKALYVTTTPLYGALVFFIGENKYRLYVLLNADASVVGRRHTHM